MNNKIIDKAMKLGEIVKQKNADYGKVFEEVPRILDILYPDGIVSYQYEDILAVVRILDKISRISRGNQSKEDAWLDIAGYALLMMK